MAGAANAIIDYFTKTVYSSERFMIGQCMPRRKGQILTKLVLLGCVKLLLRNADRCHFIKWGFGFSPFRGCVFDVQFGRSSGLNQKLHASLALLQGIAHRLSEEIGARFVRDGIFRWRTGSSGKLDDLSIGSDPELVRHRRPVAGLQRI